MLEHRSPRSGDASVLIARDACTNLRAGRDYGVWSDARGIAMVEYLIIVAVVGLGVIAAIRALGKSVDDAAQQDGKRIVAMLALPIGLASGGSTMDSELREPARRASAAPISQDTLNEIKKQPPAERAERAYRAVEGTPYSARGHQASAG